MFQAVMDHFIPSAALIFRPYREYAEFHQGKDELAMAFSNHMSKLANQSKRGGQEYTKVRQILTFVKGLQEGFHDFSKDYFSGRICLTETSLQDTTALAKTLEQTFGKKAHNPHTRGD